MSDQYVGEIRTFGFNFAPYGWFLCNGQTLSIQAYTTLFAVIGTYFGGNGTTNFQLPNLQGSVPMHWGNAPSGSVYDLGELAGSTNVTLNSSQVPSHSHLLQVAENAGNRTSMPTPTTWLGNAEPGQAYIPTGTPNVNLSLECDRSKHRRPVAPREHAAVPDHQFLHRLYRSVPVRG